MALINQSRNSKLASNVVIILILLGLNSAFIGGSYYKIAKSQQLSLTRINDFKYISNLNDEIQSDILEASRYVEKFELNNQLDDLAGFDEKTSRVKKNLADIKNLMRSDEDKRLIANIEEVATRYQYNFHTATKVSTELGLTEESGVLSQFNNRMKDISKIVSKANDEKLTEKYLLLQKLQEDYLKVKNDAAITPEQVIVAQKNFLDRVNRSAGDYGSISKMMVQTISLMQSFELLKNVFEEKKFLVKQTEADKLQLQASLKQLSELSQTYKNEDEQLVARTEQQNFIMFLAGVILVIVSVALGWFLLNRTASRVDERLPA